VARGLLAEAAGQQRHGRRPMKPTVAGVGPEEGEDLCRV
jgi:hypothetical protein